MTTFCFNPIIRNLLDVDFYKFLMWQIIFTHFKNTPVVFGFKNRTTSVKLAKFINENDLRRELDHVRTLRFTDNQIAYLESIREYGENLFCKEFLKFLRDFQLPAYELEFQGDDINLNFPGAWSETTLWETISLSIINELYYRSKMSELSPAQQEERYQVGRDRLNAKIERILKNPKITFSEFGTRRRFSRDWQEYVVTTLAAKLPKKQFRGTSNVQLAMTYGLVPIGTNAHELPMVFAGFMQETDDQLRNAPHEVLRLWWEQYGEKLSIILPDAFGSDHLLKTLSLEFAKCFRGFRHDSGCPFKFAEKIIKFYTDRKINPAKKVIVFSDGLTIDKIEELTEKFIDMINVTFGWGTDLTNDLGFAPLSLVTKAIMACGHWLVKLSDNLAKATGPKEEILRYARVFGYTNTHSEQLVY